jgi:hypothetical protein
VAATVPGDDVADKIVLVGDVEALRGAEQSEARVDTWNDVLVLFSGKTSTIDSASG